MGDMVNVQALLVQHLGIEKLHNVVGGSMGGNASPGMGGPPSGPVPVGRW